MGRILSVLLEKRFVDTDSLYVVESGLTIEKTVARFGWEYFRQREKEIIFRTCDEKDQVVATGGGAVLNPASVEKMKESGRIVWLRASEDTIHRRMVSDRGTKAARPSLTGQSSADEMAGILLQRTPIYRNAADFQVITDTRPPESIADEISRWLKRVS